MLDNLLEALKYSPNNIPLKIQVAKIYSEQGDYEKAIEHLTSVISIENSNKSAKYELANCF